MQIQYLDGPRLRRALLAACDYAKQQRTELNRINVFPVPDGDTGTNLALTVQSIADHLQSKNDREVSVVAHEAAQGAVLGARGNCGMMLSHFLLGFAEAVASSTRISTGEFSAALHSGTERLYAALERPVEGTILTVMRDTASAAAGPDTPDFVPLLTHIVGEARRSLAGTPELLPVLKKAGVVDAGAKGFVSLLEGVLLFVRGDLSSLMSYRTGDGSVEAVAEAEYAPNEEQFQFCTEALVRGSELPSQETVQEVLRHHGDSLIVIRAAEVLKVHLHTDGPEEVFEYLKGLGVLVTHKAEDMRAQHAAIKRAAQGHITLARRPVTIVTDSACDLPEEVIRAHGIHVTPLSLVDGEQTYRDGVDMTATDFHHQLESGGDLLTTSQPSPAAFTDTFTNAADEGEALVGVLAASTISGTFGSAEAAAAGFDRVPIHLVDSRGASLLEGMLVLKAAELAELGHAPGDIVLELRRIRSQSGILFTVGDYARLVASGRVSSNQALLGQFLRINPILGLRPDGSVTAFGKGFGRRGARARLMRLLRDQIPRHAKQLRFGVVHVGCEHMVGEISSEIREEYGDHIEILSAPATPVIATHTGIGTWGVAFLVED